MNFQAILGNFSLILFVLTIITGVIWCFDVFYLARQRRLKANVVLANFDTGINHASIEENILSRRILEANLLRQPTWVEYSGSFFPVIALVFVLRSFLYEPFKIPSSSMVPTLLVGDLILVNKFTYGIRLPIINKKIFDLNTPKRGDVMVFKYPKDISLDYIKRVVGVPGDRIVYKNKRLNINGRDISYTLLPDFLDEERLSYSSQLLENLSGVQHRILNDDGSPTFVLNPDAFPKHELCSYNVEGFSCSVPEGYYFMMGDNRDNSLDSRYWGFVPDKNIVGKAFFIWMNLSNFPNNLSRIGNFH